MIGPTRLQVRDALFTFIQTIPGFAYYDKRFYMPKSVPEQPALILKKMGEDWAREEILKKRTWEYWLYLYYSTGQVDQTVQPAPGGAAPGENTLDPLLDAIDTAFDIDDSGGDDRFTLGGLVFWCWIEGEGPLEVGDAEATGQGWAVVPVKVLVP